MEQPLTQHISMQVLGTMPPGRLTSSFRDTTWHIHSSDLAVPHYFRCSYVGRKARPASINNVKQKIQECKVFVGPLSATTYNNLSITTALV
jgi:hypothetical protein